MSSPAIAPIALPTAPAAPSAYVLLDDAREGASRLYTGLLQVLECSTAQQWPALWQNAEQGLQAGQHAVALLSYESGAQLHGIPAYPASFPALPSRILLFARCDRLDAEQVDAWLAAQVIDVVPAGIAGVIANVDEQAFSAAIERVRDYIAAGDTYQVNYTYRLHFDAYGSPLALYRRLRQRQPVPYGALALLPDGSAVLSLSPELFVRRQDTRLQTRPMKGTAAASGDADEDARRAAALQADIKNRAENLMIVDLLRNDLGRIAATGSVRVPQLFDVQRYASVLQMTSTVEAELPPQTPLAEIFDALYPCGSITGAPKHRTMQIIRELESEPRGLYTGAIGWIEPPGDGQGSGDFCLSVPIRTLQLQPPAADGGRRGVLGVGAGIVYDSTPADEYAECKLKASFLTGLPPDFALIETMHATREAGCRQLERHLQRLAGSARYFGFAYDEAVLRLALQQACAALEPQREHRMRLSLAADGVVSLQSGALLPLASPAKLMLAPSPVEVPDLFLRHKTSVRAAYDAAWKEAERQGAFDMLFVNRAGRVSEGGRSTLLVCQQGRWYTPPLSDGVLPGVMRSVLMDDSDWRVEEKSFSLDEVRRADKLMLCNALRGAFEVELVE